MSRPAIFAHRGASAVQFENTMKAFEEAVDQGADGIELDVQMTEDGVPIVIHDADLSRLAGIHRTISSMTSTEIAMVRVGKKYIRIFNGCRIPTLIEVVTFCERHGLMLNVELKETVSEHPECLRQIIDNISYMENVHISSFDYLLLKKVKEIDQYMETAYLVKKNSVEWDHLGRYTSADGFHLHKRLLKEPYVSKLIQSGKKMRIYGMTGLEEIVFDPPSFIDGWITDYPNRFLKKD